VRSFEANNFRDEWLISVISLLDRIAAAQQALQARSGRSLRRNDSFAAMSDDAQMFAAALCVLKLSSAEAECDPLGIKDLITDLSKFVSKHFGPCRDAAWKQIVEAEFRMYRLLEYKVGVPSAADLNMRIILDIVNAARKATGSEVWPGLKKERVVAPRQSLTTSAARVVCLSSYLVELGLVHAQDEVYRDGTPPAALALAAAKLALYAFGEPPAQSIFEYDKAVKQILKHEEAERMLPSLESAIRAVWKSPPSDRQGNLCPVVVKWRARQAKYEHGPLPEAWGCSEPLSQAACQVEPALLTPQRELRRKHTPTTGSKPLLGEDDTTRPPEKSICDARLDEEAQKLSSRSSWAAEGVATAKEEAEQREAEEVSRAEAAAMSAEAAEDDILKSAEIALLQTTTLPNSREAASALMDVGNRSASAPISQGTSVAPVEKGADTIQSVTRALPSGSHGHPAVHPVSGYPKAADLLIPHADEARGVKRASVADIRSTMKDVLQQMPTKKAAGITHRQPLADSTNLGSRHPVAELSRVFQGMPAAGKPEVPAKSSATRVLVRHASDIVNAPSQRSSFEPGCNIKVEKQMGQLAVKQSAAMITPEGLQKFGGLWKIYTHADINWGHAHVKEDGVFFYQKGVLKQTQRMQGVGTDKDPFYIKSAQALDLNQNSWKIEADYKDAKPRKVKWVPIVTLKDKRFSMWQKVPEDDEKMLEKSLTGRPSARRERPLCSEEPEPLEKRRRLRAMPSGDSSSTERHTQASADSKSKTSTTSHKPAKSKAMKPFLRDPKGSSQRTTVASFLD
jgi:hypothetical protein